MATRVDNSGLPESRVESPTVPKELIGAKQIYIIFLYLRVKYQGVKTVLIDLRNLSLKN